MSLIRRISTSITSSVDRAVSKVENHDAIINAALRDTQQAAARSRVRLERVKKDGHNLKTRHANLKQATGRWTERARKIAAEDEAKALECLRRARRADRQAEELDRRLGEHERVEKQLATAPLEVRFLIDESNHRIAVPLIEDWLAQDGANKHDQMHRKVRKQYRIRFREWSVFVRKLKRQNEREQR